MITKAKYLKNYEIEVTFYDNTVKVIDLSKFIKDSKNPFIKKFENIALFKTVRVENGTLSWGDNEFDINPVSIYKGEFDKTKFYKKIMKAEIDIKKGRTKTFKKGDFLKDLKLK